MNKKLGCLCKKDVKNLVLDLKNGVCVKKI